MYYRNSSECKSLCMKNAKLTREREKYGARFISITSKDLKRVSTFFSLFLFKMVTFRVMLNYWT